MAAEGPKFYERGREGWCKEKNGFVTEEEEEEVVEAGERR